MGGGGASATTTASSSSGGAATAAATASTACTICHGPGSNDVEPTPMQTGGYTDAELVDIFTKGKKPAGVEQRIMPAERWSKIHQWSMTELATKGLVVYLRSLEPASRRRPRPRAHARAKATDLPTISHAPVCPRTRGEGTRVDLGSGRSHAVSTSAEYKDCQEGAFDRLLGLEPVSMSLPGAESFERLPPKVALPAVDPGLVWLHANCGSCHGRSSTATGRALSPQSSFGASTERSAPASASAR